MNGSVSRSDRFRYAFDNFMSKGGLSIFLALMTLFLLAFAMMGAVRVVAVALFGDPAAGELGDQLWRTFLQVTDAGAIAEDGDSNWLDKVIGISTIGVGLVLFSSLVAFITAEFDARLAELRKGRSTVIEEGHTLILGCGDRAVEIIRELVVANESEKDAAVVVLADMPKDEMDDFFLDRVPERKSTRIVTRSGSPSSLPTLRRMGIERAKAVIVLNSATGSDPAEDRERGDAQVLKAIMAALAACDGSPPPIVAEIHSDRRRSLAEGIVPGKVTTLAEKKLLAQLLVQTSRTSGLAVVYDNLVGFVGNEIYFYKPDSGWQGRTFGRLQHHFPQSVPLGFRLADGQIVLNPAPDFVPPNDADVIVLAEDDSTIGYSPAEVSPPAAKRLPPVRGEVQAERQLLVGWSEKAALIVADYARFLTAFSAIDVLVPEADDELRASIDALRENAPNVAIEVIEGDARDPEFVAELKPERYNNVILLAGEGDSAEEKDASTIALLLVFRQYFRGLDESTLTTQLITEVMDSDNTELVLRSGVKDFLISNQFVSKIFAQVSQEPDVMRVYDDLFQPEGSEIYIKPTRLYFPELPAQVTFAEITSAAQLRGEVCFAVKIGAEATNAAANYGVKIIPRKDERFTLTADDALVVLAEDET